MERSIYALAPYQDNTPSPRLTRSSLVQLATIFVPQDRNLTPEAHFPLQIVFSPNRLPYPRFTNRFDSREMLLVIDGSCVNNGRHANKLEPPVGGCSFMFKAAPSMALASPTTPVTFPFLNPAGQEVSGSVAFRLEREGPNGERAEHTSNRAKLRAVIAALQFHTWAGEGWRRVVILTDLEYIVHGATAWLPRWVKRRWRKPGGQGEYLNRDLWEEMHYWIVELRAQGCEVSFWLVTNGRGSQIITQAKAAAQTAARAHPEAQVDKFTRTCGVMF
ncbi:hypothetical protein MFIFM68171_06317 [Madurella fahalii]|uniref:RNase H type-1 domain-containing protein n=1 Tax=Madurella fahalii TaxID=1157608 RepID=A0ABQ0GEE3_9PEZI